MKLKIALFCLVSGIAANGATTLAVSNGTTNGAVWQIVDNAGVPVGSSGQVLIGTFSDTAGLATAAAGEVLSRFTQAGIQPFNANAALAGTFGFAGASSGSVDLPNVGSPAGNLVGQPVFAVITDGSDFAIVDLGRSFEFENATFDTGIDINPNIVSLGESAIVRGVFNPSGRLESALPTPNNGTATLQLGVIPEPSSLLLGGVALLGALLRRRR